MPEGGEAKVYNDDLVGAVYVKSTQPIPENLLH
jgi:hypothetical protein